MICVGIDVAKDKHDCFILSSESVVLADVFTIPNSLECFNTLLDKLRACSTPQGSIRVGLEATGHYSYNILWFLLDNGLPTYVLNPLRTNLYRKNLSLRKTKTDRVDTRTIAAMLLSDAGLKPYTDTAYHNEELKSLTRCSIGSRMPAESLELHHTIRLIRELDAEIEEIETAIQAIMDELHSPITTIPGIGCRMGAIILAGIGDISRFDSPDKLLAYAGMSPSTYQSGQLKNCYPHMEKRGSRYLRYALYNAAKYVCH